MSSVNKADGSGKQNRAGAVSLTIAVGTLGSLFPFGDAAGCAQDQLQDWAWGTGTGES